MPTARARHMITETDQISHGLSQAAKKWPELAEHRTLLLRKIIEAGLQAISLDETSRAQKRLTSVKKIAGSMDGVWPTNWKEELAEDWPE